MDLNGDEQKALESPSYHCSALACSWSTIHLIDKHTPQSLTLQLSGRLNYLIKGNI